MNVVDGIEEADQRGLHAHCYRPTGNVADADDLAQETHVRAWRSRGTFAARSSVRTWLYRIAANAYLDQRKAAARRSIPSGDPLEWSTDIGPYPDALLGSDPAAESVANETVELALIDGGRPPVLLDVTFHLGGPSGRLDFDRGHLPGAVFVDLEVVFAGPLGAGGRHPLPEATVLQDGPVLDAEGAASTARDGVLIDARVAARFRGETEPVDPVAGHIPGAVNVPMAELLTQDKRLRPPADLRETFATAGVGGSVARVGSSCGSGITAAHTALAMTVAGLPMPSVYIGSWSRWITDPDRPIATGDEDAH